MTETSPIYNTISALDAEDEAATYNTTATPDETTTAYGASAAHSAATMEEGDNNKPATSHLASHVSIQDSDPSDIQYQASSEDGLVRHHRRERSTAGGVYLLREVEEREGGSRHVHREYENPGTGVSYLRDLRELDCLFQVPQAILISG
ncbi:uncharacterized protein BO97DRAFT_440179 [Aspergillus homomorphus CBS 101889]|uniref:Uncharacterized protein n=1 Tax=Aspergillus homomorphus (strain CBS 101889) TaxID=1450537 RepID=A0A395I843_ASPHC|nr:hypothetical protein BO97DRAFT_440179 [Aspergillus homomorphus CBS 101889]RAL16402.1 hypothetical protein BO97DRAFT_440179 [Aspergillus homomorphus CBS 101889]